jgi:hypothetical protein
MTIIQTIAITYDQNIKNRGTPAEFFSKAAHRLLILNSQDTHFGRLVGSASLNRANAFGIVPGTQRSSPRPMPCTPQADADLHEDEALAVAPDLDWGRLPDLKHAFRNLSHRVGLKRRTALYRHIDLRNGELFASHHRPGPPSNARANHDADDHIWHSGQSPLNVAAIMHQAASFCTSIQGTRAFGLTDFEALRREGAGDVAVLYAFDLMELHGSDLHSLPIETHKATLASLLRDPPRRASVPALLHR